MEGESGMSFYEVLPASDDVFERLENRDAVMSAVGELSDAEREMIGWRYGKELSQAETARRMGVSQMYISRMERKILEKLRKSLKSGMAE